MAGAVLKYQSVISGSQKKAAAWMLCFVQDSDYSIRFFLLLLPVKPNLISQIHNVKATTKPGSTII